MSNLLALPLIALTIETGNNEDWIDSIVYVVDTEGMTPEDSPQLDLRGITFEMEVRRNAGDAEVIVAASTASGSLRIGDPPNYGFLLFNLLLPDMQRIRAGSYVADVTGRDGQNVRRVISISQLTIVEGVTKQPVNRRVIVQAAA